MEVSSGGIETVGFLSVDLFATSGGQFRNQCATLSFFYARINVEAERGVGGLGIGWGF